MFYFNYFLQKKAHGTWLAAHCKYILIIGIINCSISINIEPLIMN